MTKRISRGRKPGLDVLESRETPSASGLHAAGHHLAQPKGIAFSGVEHVTYPKLHTVPTSGGFVLTGTGTGSVTGVGTFKAKVTDGVAPDIRSFSIIETLNDGKGDQTTIGINGYYRHKPDNSSSTRAYITSTGGTGLFAHTVIHGTAEVSAITSTVYPASQMTIRFQGNISPAPATRV